MTTEGRGNRMQWTLKKKNLLRDLENALAEQKVDPPIVPLINLINSLGSYCTSSSCSGRTMLLQMDRDKKDAGFHRKWHEAWENGELEKEIRSYQEKKNLWLFCQGFILHVHCRDLEAGEKLLGFCRTAGLKRAGIISTTGFPVVELMSNTYLGMPVWLAGKRVVGELGAIEEICLEKMRENRELLAKITSSTATILTKD